MNTIILNNKNEIIMINPEYDYNLDKTLIGHTDYVISLLQLSNGMLVSGSGDGTIIIWNPNDDYNLVKTLTGHTLIYLSLNRHKFI